MISSVNDIGIDDESSILSRVASSTNPSVAPLMATVPSVVGNLLPWAKDTEYRAVHQIRLSALAHNYDCVESAAAKQKCSVIVVVKADGYGHGAISTAIHLADTVKADAFAVATLEEGIALRKAFETIPPGATRRRRSRKSSKDGQLLSGTGSETVQTKGSVVPQRPPHIRIVVLGPPVGYPRCFDDYYYFNIEVMVSGPEVAKALMEWVMDSEARKRTLVERAAAEAKAQALVATQPSITNDVDQTDQDLDASGSSVAYGSATLSTVSGQNLANEVRAILLNKQKNQSSRPSSNNNSGRSTPAPGSTTLPLAPSGQTPSKSSDAPSGGAGFQGIEAAALSSRQRERAAKATEVFVEDSSDNSSMSTSLSKAPAGGRPRRRLRWHALVDSGMGRLGFKAYSDGKSKQGERESLALIKELADMELLDNTPLEFYGMCTHMADANPTSDYTQAQITRFESLLGKVRDSGILVPSISTDNSAALLTPVLTHFDPNALLTQSGANTRGFVRTGGAIFGQRPAFKQLRAVSTLKAAVRHVAILKEGESVGYDRAYRAPMDVRIATLTIGFADGYPRELSNGVGKVSIRNTAFPTAGNVCMDMLMVELGPASDEGVGSDVVVGDVAVLWGPDGEDDDEGLIRLQDIASRLQTTQSALTCGLNKTRVLREYV